MEGNSGKAVRTVSVDAGRLSEGLKTAFKGVAMVFESIGVDLKIPEIPEKQDAEENGVSSGGGSAGETADADVREEKPVSGKAAQEAGTKELSLTLDDVTKVIVQKIKKNRSNNEKIGQILKTFHAAKVSDLPADKYEAFLTELAAL